MERIAVFDVEFSVPGRIAFDSDAERVRVRRQRLVVFERVRVVHPERGLSPRSHGGSYSLRSL